MARLSKQSKMFKSQTTFRGPFLKRTSTKNSKTPPFIIKNLEIILGVIILIVVIIPILMQLKGLL